jgi:zinc protease
LPSDFVDQQNKILSSLTKADVNKLAAKWVNPNRMNILLVGDKQLILPGLQKLGYEIIELDINGNIKTDNSKPAGVKLQQDQK